MNDYFIRFFLKGVVSVSSATTSAQIRLQDESLQRSSQNKSSLDNDSFQVCLVCQIIITCFKLSPIGKKL